MTVVTADESPPLLTVREAHAILAPLNVSLRTTYRLASSGQLGPYRSLMGLRAIRLRKDAVEAYLRAQQPGGQR